MGEVYRATDTKLGRDVALKILAVAFASDAGRMARFTREAQVLASASITKSALNSELDRIISYNEVVTFEERLDRLVERHEALAQSVEMLVRSGRESQARNEEFFARNEESFARNEQLFGQVALRLREVTDSIDSLARIAGVHQERLDGHEQRLGDLERGPGAGS